MEKKYHTYFSIEFGKKFSRTNRGPGVVHILYISGSLTSVVQVFLGFQAGQIIMTYKNDMQRIIRLISWGLVTGLIGFALNGTTRDEGLIPINKNLWYVHCT